MRKKQHATQSLRFRRWSRKAYATFISIGRCVSIGCLRKNVADSSLSKQKKVSSILSVYVNNGSSSSILYGNDDGELYKFNDDISAFYLLFNQLFQIRNVISAASSFSVKKESYFIFIENNVYVIKKDFSITNNSKVLNIKYTLS